MSEPMLRRTYTLSALVGSSVTGAAFGIALALVRGGFSEPGSALPVLLSAVAAGGICGAILLPAATAVLLHHLPVWRALLGIGVATTVGAAVASAFFSFDPALTALGAAAGFLVSTLWLRRSASDSAATRRA